MQLFIFWGSFSSWRAFISTCIIILDGYLHSHPSGLTCFVIFPLHFPLLSIPFHSFFLSSSLYYLSLSLFFLSLCCYELTFPCAAGVVVPEFERELLKKHLRLPTSLSGYAPSQFLQLVLLKSWMKNDNTQSPDRFETGWWELFTSN